MPNTIIQTQQLARLMSPLWKVDFLLCNSPQWARASLPRFLDHTRRHTTLGRTRSDAWSARRRDLYLATHNTHNRHPCPRWDSDPQFQQASGCRPTPRPRGHRDRRRSLKVYCKSCRYDNIDRTARLALNVHTHVKHSHLQRFLCECKLLKNGKREGFKVFSALPSLLRLRHLDGRCSIVPTSQIHASAMLLLPNVRGCLRWSLAQHSCPNPSDGFPVEIRGPYSAQVRLLHSTYTSSRAHLASCSTHTEVKRLGPLTCI
jgi:hypothetical protein